jgi:ABC-type sugar transport system ATPase subunit
VSAVAPDRRAEPVLEVVGVGKRFPGVQALADVSFDVLPAAIHGLVGQNGAGKSTLVKVIAGADRPDDGEIRLEGRTLALHSPADAVAAGIGVVHQQSQLSENLSVAENFALVSGEYSRRGLVDRRRAAADAAAYLAEFGVRVDPSRRVGELSIAYRQLVALARTVHRGGKVLILDEPTSSLSPAETEHLFEILRTLAQGGHAIVFISHRLPEIFTLCERVTVLRNGRVVATRPTSSLDDDSLTRLMIGKTLARATAARPQSEGGEEVLRVSVRERHGDEPVVPQLVLARGRITGLLGLPGSGREDVFAALVGLSPALRCSADVRGRAMAPSRLLGELVGLVPGDRLGAGIFGNLSVLENIAIGRIAAADRRVPLLRRRRAEQQAAAAAIDRFQIRCRDRSQRVATLSGGNQQKVVISRVLAQNVPVVLLDEPTQGVDVGSREEIYELLATIREGGKAILIGSQDPGELIRLCDSITVLHNWAYAATFAPPYDEEHLLRVAAGGTVRDAADGGPAASSRSEDG